MTPPRLENPVLLLLAAFGGSAAVGAAFLDVAPNRLARGTAVSLWQAPPLAVAAILAVLATFLLLAFMRNSALRSGGAYVGALVLLAAVLLGAGHLATLRADPASPAMRLSLATGFWSLLAIALIAVLDTLQRARLALLGRCAAVGLVIAVPIAIAVFSQLNALSLAREFASRRTLFVAALGQHVLLVVLALAFALLLGAPLTLLLHRRPAFRRSTLQGLNLLQTIPSIALFGLLIAPLSALATAAPALAAIGIGGTGAAPALIALVLYALMPLVRSFDTGLREVSGDARDAAKGLGFTARQRFLQVELPLALPALVSGLRIVTVQTIGLATVAALIGAGGLGSFIFQGIGQYALDLVLLGALPVILLALAADFGFQLALASLRGAP